jgi:hypothetical protein
MTVTVNPVLNTSRSTLNFTYDIRFPAPESQTILMASFGKPLNVVATLEKRNGDFLKLHQSSGTTPSNLTIELDPSAPSGLGPGMYNQTVNIDTLDSGD